MRFTSKSLSEKDVLNKLDIPDFRHMSKDKFWEFCSLYEQMDPDVAKAAIGQFPEFAKMILAAADDYKDILQRALDDASESEKAVFQSYDLIIETLREQASREGLSEEEKWRYIDKMVEVAQLKDVKDRETKEFRLKVAGVASTAVAAVACFGYAILGGKIDVRLPSPK